MLGVGHGPNGAADSAASAGPIAWDAGELANHDRTALAILASVQGLGPVTSGLLIAALGSPTAVLARATEPGAGAALVAASVHQLADASWRHGLSAAVAEHIVEAALRRDEILPGDREARPAGRGDR